MTEDQNLPGSQHPALEPQRLRDRLDNLDQTMYSAQDLMALAQTILASAKNGVEVSLIHDGEGSLMVAALNFWAGKTKELPIKIRITP